MKEGKAMFKAAAAQGKISDLNNIETMPRIDSQLEEAADVTDDRIESRLISDNNNNTNRR